MQGTTQVSDEDFFRIADDKKSLAETLDMRASGRRWYYRGIGLMAVGLIASVVGYEISNETARYGLIGVGGVSAAFGGLVFYYGGQLMSPDNHAVDRSIAERAAGEYNRRLGLSVGKSF